MEYKIFSFLCLIIFYAIYIYKLVSLNNKGIKTNQVGKGKNNRVKLIEKIMSLFNILIIIVMVISIIIVKPIDNNIIIIISFLLSILSVIFFFLSTYTMKDNWRVGIPLEKTNIVINSIYKWSRNPAFVGFDLLYISNTLLYFNIPLLFCCVFAIVCLHIQIIEEEKHMLKTFKKEYENYKKHTLRYFGRVK